MNEIALENDSYNLLNAHIEMMRVHCNALAAHCKCLGMNAENCTAAQLNATIPYSDSDYYQVMRDWGLMDKEGKSLI